MQYPIEVLLRDPLSEVSRKERKFLLGVCAISITIVETGLVPNKISALGVDFSPADQKSLLVIMALIVAYFLIAFMIYAVSDFIVWRIAFHSSVRSSLKQIAEEKNNPDNKTRAESAILESRILPEPRFAWASIHKPISFLRALLDFLLPVILGVITIGLLLFSNVVKR